MRKRGLVLTMILLLMFLLLTACSVSSEPTAEYVEDGLETAESSPYRIVFGVPENVTQETFGEESDCQVYEAENGDYMITAEVMDATSVEEAMETISGIPAERLDAVKLNRLPMDEYHFAWSSSGEEGDTVSRCALIEGEDYYYALTMTQRAGLGTTYDETANYVFSTFSLTVDEEI